MSSNTKAVTVKLDSDLYQLVADVSALTGRTIRDLLSDALRHETERARKDPKMRETLESMKSFRSESLPSM